MFYRFGDLITLVTIFVIVTLIAQAQKINSPLTKLIPLPFVSDNIFLGETRF